MAAIPLSPWQGIGYSRMGYNFKHTFTDHGGFYTDPGNTITMSEKIFYDYIEFPLRFSSQINNSSAHSFFIDVNVINQLFISYKQTSYVGGETKYNCTEVQDKDWEIYNLAFQLCVPYQKRFANNFFLGLAPFYKINFKGDFRTWSVGLKIAMGYNF